MVESKWVAENLKTSGWKQKVAEKSENGWKQKAAEKSENGWKQKSFWKIWKPAVKSKKIAEKF